MLFMARTYLNFAYTWANTYYTCQKCHIDRLDSYFEGRVQKPDHLVLGHISQIIDLTLHSLHNFVTFEPDMSEFEHVMVLFGKIYCLMTSGVWTGIKSSRWRPYQWHTLYVGNKECFCCHETFTSLSLHRWCQRKVFTWLQSKLCNFALRQTSETCLSCKNIETVWGPGRWKWDCILIRDRHWIKPEAVIWEGNSLLG